MAPDLNSWAITVEIECRLIPETYAKWQISIFNAIMDAYNKQLAEYEEKLTTAKIQAGVNILGNNPETNRIIERTELKRGAIELFTGQKFDTFDAMADNVSEGYPQFNNREANAEGHYVKFMEQAFEWHNMVYLFYPYFWGRKRNWKVVKNHEDVDPLFTAFLQAGFARVVVPVRPMFTEAVLHFVKSGQVWNGSEPPLINDELYLSIVNEIKEAQEKTGGDDVGEPWVVKVPTNLVMLQQDVPPTLPDFS